MNLSHRKLLADSLCESVCTPEAKATNGHCSDFCQGRCPEPCSVEYPPLVPPQDDDPVKTPHPNASQKLFHESVIISLSILGVVCFIFCLRIIYRRYKNRENLRRGLPNQDQGQTRDEFFDEENGPILDHPIWYIRTVGLQPSLIDLITVCKYKRGEGLVEGTECSVCLSEFEDDETLRLLPKCNHAFHIPCIDTWLRSHTNCPMCRAPIFANPDWASSPILERSAENSAAQGEAQGVVPVGSGELARERESGEFESGRETEQLQTSFGTKGVESSEQQGIESVEIREKDEIQPMRRSVSMDYLTASMLFSALASSRFGESNETNMGIGPKRNHQKKGQVRMNRSVSCSGKLMFSRQ